MKTFLFACVLLTSLSLFSCVTQPYYLKSYGLTKSNDLIYSDGRPITVSFMPKSTVAVSGYCENGYELILHVYYRNDDQDNRVNIFPSDISIIGSNAKGKEKRLKVFDAQEYLNKIRNDAKAAVFMQSIGTAMSTVNDGYSQSITRSNYGTAVTTTYDPSKVSTSTYRNNQELRQIRQDYQDKYSSTNGSLVKSNTLIPKGFVEGNVIVDFNGKYHKVVAVNIPIGNETHKFIFTTDEKQDIGYLFK